MSVVVVGSINADLVIHCHTAPGPGQTITGSNFSTGVGGKGLNQCAAAALQDGKVAMIGCIGNDANGKMCLDVLNRLHVDTTYVKKVEDSTGVAMITVESNGENRIVLASGSNSALDEAYINTAREVISTAAIAIFQLESPLLTIAHALRLAAEGGATTILNPAPAVDLSDDILADVSILVPNETEAELLSGQSVKTVEQAGEAGRKLLARGIKTAVVVTLGSQGCCVVTHEFTQHIPAENVQVVDTTA